MELTLENSLVIDFPGGPLRLRPDGSVHAGQALIVADVQLGADALVRLTDALMETEAVSLVFLGDLWDQSDGIDEDLVSGLIKWRARHPELKMWFVSGAGHQDDAQMLDLLEIQQADEGSRFGTVTLRHTPPDAGEGWLAGCIRPAHHLKSARRAERLPCFWATGGGLVLPSFDNAAVQTTVEPNLGDRIYLISGHKVIQVPLSSPKRKR